MKRFFILLVLCLLNATIAAQQTFILKNPDTLKLKRTTQESNYDINVILTYLEKNYKATSKKTDIKKDPDFNHKECGFTKKFEFNISYTLYECGEASPVKEEISFPKVSDKRIKRWVELIYSCYAMDIPNIWYPKKQEYGPDNKEAGCYYTITQTKNRTKVNTWCGS